MKVLLLHRAKEFSPNNIEKDALILAAIESALLLRGDSVVHLQEEELTADHLKPVDVVVSMVRRFSSLMMLEKSGKRVINVPAGVRNALSRETTLDLLVAAEVPVPPYWAHDPVSDEMFLCDRRLHALLPGWVKGMHPRGVREGDVQYVSTPIEADSRVIQLVAEGYTDIVVTRHESGFVVKVYCVAGRMIHWMLPQQSGYTKFGDEVHNDAPTREEVDVQQLERLAERIGEAMQLQIFGFDAIVSGPGELFVIDVNDAPSFSACRELAAEKIVELL